MAKKSTVKKNDLVTESDVVIPTVTVEEAINEMSQLDILDWQKWHTLSVVSSVSEDDSDIEAPREIEVSLKDLILEHLKSEQSESFSELAKMTGAAQPSLFEIIKEIHSDGYCIVVEDTESDATVYFGLAAEAKLYEKINKPVVTTIKIGRKQEVLELLKTGKHYKIPDLAKALGITDRNVSSQLSYLRADGHAIATDARGFKFLENHTA